MTPDKCGDVVVSSFFLGFIVAAVICSIALLAYVSGLEDGKDKK